MKNDDNRLRRRQLDFQTKTWGKWIRLEGDFYFWFCKISIENNVNFVFVARRIWEKDDDWKSTTTDFYMNLGWKKMSNEIQWQLNFMQNDNNQQRKNLST